MMEDDSDEESAGILSGHGFAVRQWPSIGAFLAGGEHGEPGCVLVDLCRPDMDGATIQHRLVAQPVALPTIIATRSATVPAVVALMRAGAIDVLERPVSRSALLAAIDRAMEHIENWRARTLSIEAAKAKITLLSPREREVLDRLIDGASNKAIAQELSISARTVEIHRARVMAKLNATSLATVLRTAFQAGVCT